MCLGLEIARDVIVYILLPVGHLSGKAISLPTVVALVAHKNRLPKGTE